jgi:hypothetical protein
MVTTMDSLHWALRGFGQMLGQEPAPGMSAWNAEGLKAINAPPVL